MLILVDRLIVIEVHMQAEGALRSLFGFITVPAALYPIVLLLVLQLIFPNASFFGHLSGILCGYLLLKFAPYLLVRWPLQC